MYTPLISMLLLAGSNTLRTRLLPREFAKINEMQRDELSNEVNLSLCFDGWSGRSGNSLYACTVVTSSGKTYLWWLKDLSGIKHTADNLRGAHESNFMYQYKYLLI
jgi:hypothetical protein